jgi:hypothetical protein
MPQFKLIGGIEQLTQLQELDVSECETLQSIASVSSLIWLRHFYLGDSKWKYDRGSFKALLEGLPRLNTIFGGENSFAQSSNRLSKVNYSLSEIEDWFHNKH